MELNNDESLEKDINNVFDAIVFSEEQISSEAFQEGLTKGKEDGKFEGYHLGFHRGLEFGTEIGFYKGLTKVIFSNFSDIKIKNKEKTHTLLEKLISSLDDFPAENSQNVDLIKKINDIRANIKKLNSLLKLNLSIPVCPVMSF